MQQRRKPVLSFLKINIVENKSKLSANSYLESLQGLFQVQYHRSNEMIYSCESSLNFKDKNKLVRKIRNGDQGILTALSVTKNFFVRAIRYLFVCLLSYFN